MKFPGKLILPSIFLVVIAALFGFGGSVAQAQTTPDLSDKYYRAKVVKILETGEKAVEDSQTLKYQKLELQILNGDEKGKRVIIDHGATFVVSDSQMAQEGEQVIIAKTPELPGGKSVYYITDKYRLNNLIAIVLIFFATAIYFARKRGVTSIIGMLFSVFIIFYYIIPSISKGANPFWVCLGGSVVILLVSLYFSHGFNKRTSLALVSSFISLGLAAIINILFVSIAKLSGNGTEEVFYLQFANSSIDMRGLLLGGIIIGVLGVLDDVTTAQTAVVEEISLANNSFGFQELYKRGLSVGREHISSLVNTLVLAYAGISLPLLLLYSSQKSQPIWMAVNSAFIAEEIVRTLVGSTVLVLAVPITTILAAWAYSRKNSLLLNR
ncbi:MAG: YibE/F family protein [Candidatus Magasanikbacteria bacterium]|nr:YibE/F family protein [Candidatus Magasanikbacteria bacterium]